MRVGFSGLPSSGSAGVAPRQGTAENITDVSAALDSLGLTRYLATAPTRADGEYGLVYTDSRTNQKVAIYGADGVSGAAVNTAPADGTSNTANRLAVQNLAMLFNGTTWDRQRSNQEGTLLASAARTTSTASADQTNYNWRGVLINFDITAVPGVETVQLGIQWKDPITGTYNNIATDTTVSATGARQIILYPGAVSAGSIELVSGAALPRTWRIFVTHSAAGSFTYSVAYAVIV